MAQKRPYDDEVINEVSSKHQRQDGPGDESVLCNGSFPKETDSLKLYDSGETSIRKGELELNDVREIGSFPGTRREIVEETGSDAPRSASLSHWATSSMSDDDEPPEEMAHMPFYPGYFSFDRPVRSGINPDDVYYCLLDYPPRKRVPVGPEHQAVIPDCGTEGHENTSGGDSVGNVELELGGICVIPYSDTRPLPYNSEKIGDGRTDCKCPDQGSIRCVRQHIAEARDKLRSIIGQDTFLEAGFNGMGEVVAEKWSEEEEQLFHDVVYSNPASLGKNFWNALSAVFPSRTKMEIVSYYFNVFMLRKRAEQNRYDPLNIDSDNDEWQGSDDDGGDEGGVSEDDEDSGIESPVRRDGFEFHQNGMYVHEEDDGDVSDEAREADDHGAEGNIRKSDADSAFQFQGKKSVNDEVENDIQDGSCTSSDSGASVQGTQMKNDGCHEWHEYILGSSDAKSWDVYNMSCPKIDVDFLPTCSMIEEVFGDGDFSSKDKRW